jgi:hypothetical protein
MSGFRVSFSDRPAPANYQAGIRILAKLARQILEEKRLKALEVRVSPAYSQNKAETESVNKLVGGPQ